MGSVQHNAFNTLDILNCHQPHCNFHWSWHRSRAYRPRLWEFLAEVDLSTFGPSLTTWKHVPPSLTWPWFEARGKWSYCQWEFLGRPLPSFPVTMLSLWQMAALFPFPIQASLLPICYRTGETVQNMSQQIGRNWETKNRFCPLHYGCPSLTFSAWIGSFRAGEGEGSRYDSGRLLTKVPELSQEQGFLW